MSSEDFRERDLDCATNSVDTLFAEWNSYPNISESHCNSAETNLKALYVEDNCELTKLPSSSAKGCLASNPGYELGTRIVKERRGSGMVLTFVQEA